METLLPRDRALRAVGRNLVNFQRLEALLKVLIGFEGARGPASAVLERMKMRNAKRLKLTLGNALQEWLRVVGSNDSQSPTTPDLFEPWVEMSVGLPLEERYFEMNALELEALARERNNLVHQDLVNIDFDSNEACESLASMLDVQNARINHQVSHLAPAIETIREMGKWARQPGLVDQLTNDFIRAVREDDI